MTEEGKAALRDFLLRKEFSQKKVLVAPLNWGLGHASRCIPLIEGLLGLDNQVVLMSSGASLNLLSEEFPELITIDSADDVLRYGHTAVGTRLKIALQTPRFFRNIKREAQFTKEICEQEGIEAIISDNRYGCRVDWIKSIFLGHQLNIPAPFADSLIQSLNRKFLKEFDEIWVPDYEGPNALAGKLSRRIDIGVPIEYLGPLSRFESKSSSRGPFDFDFLFILSGPEPQRSLMERDAIHGKIVNTQGKKCALVQGIPNEAREIVSPRGWECYNHLSRENLKKLIDRSETIVCRSGYSTIMDLHILERKAILIPTPGQAEQEYLAELHRDIELLAARN